MLDLDEGGCGRGLFSITRDGYVFGFVTERDLWNREISHKWAKGAQPFHA